jgi:lipopolysaccharide export system protein LptA
LKKKSHLNSRTLFLLLLFIFCKHINAQPNKTIVVEHADIFDYNQLEIPNAALLIGHVKVKLDGAILVCNKAYLYKDENYLKAFGDVVITQGDTIQMNSKDAEYNGETELAFASGNVILNGTEMTLTSDTLYFDRAKQEAFYKSGGTIVNKENTLKSITGKYYMVQKKYIFRKTVTISNPKYVIKTNHLDYYTNSGHAYLFGPSTITSKENYIYTEKGFYDTEKDLSHFVKNSHIKYNNRLIEGDSLYYNRNIEFASATNHVVITDSINKTVIKGQYGEVYKNKDSLMMTHRAVAMSLMEKDTFYVHAKKIIMTGKPQERILRGIKNVRFYKLDMSGKCDSLHSSEKTSITQLIGKPILWNFENQLTGDLMLLLSNSKTEKLDSLKVLNNAFIISKDTIGTGYNQVKGQNLFGRFEDNNLREVDIIKNTEVIYYLRNDKQELVGINKSVCSKINLLLSENTIERIREIKKVDGDIYPEKDLPENTRKLRNFVWRADERIKSKEDIFPPEEDIWLLEADKASENQKETENEPLDIRKETLEYKSEIK